MLDFVIGTAFAALAVRGWLRGLVREFFDLVGLVIGAVAGFRFAEPAGAFVATWSGATPGTARVLGGVGVFLLVGIAASVAAHFAARAMRLPGFGLTNKVGGAVFAAGWGWVLATVVFSLLALAPLPPVWQETLDGSQVASALVDPDQPVQAAFRRLSGDDTLTAALGLDALLDGQHLVLEPDEQYPLEAADPAVLERRPELEAEMVDLVNDERLDGGLVLLAANPVLSQVAADYARDMAEGGFFGHVDPTGRTVVDRVDEAGVPYRVVGENLALAATLGVAHDGLMASEGHRANILGPSWSEIGIGVIEGPRGLIAVQVFTG